MATAIGTCCCGQAGCTPCDWPSTLYLYAWLSRFDFPDPQLGAFDRNYYCWTRGAIQLNRITDKLWRTVPFSSGAYFEFEITGFSCTGGPQWCGATVRFFNCPEAGGTVITSGGCNYGWPPVGTCINCQGDRRWYLAATGGFSDLFAPCCISDPPPIPFPNHGSDMVCVVRTTPERLAHDCCCSSVDLFTRETRLFFSTSCPGCPELDQIVLGPMELTATSTGGQEFSGWTWRKSRRGFGNTVNGALSCNAWAGVAETYRLEMTYIILPEPGSGSLSVEVTTQQCSPFFARGAGTVSCRGVDLPITLTVSE